MKKSATIFFSILLFSCTSEEPKETKKEPVQQEDSTQAEVRETPMEEPKPIDSSATASYEQIELPVWFVQTGLLEGKNFYKDYFLDPRMQPHFLQADFNGDGYLDIAIPIKQKESGKKGFAIIHGNTGDVHLISAGTSVKNGLSDDMGYVDIWKINTEKVNSPGLDEDTGTGKNGELLLENPSLQIETSEIGGGQIYWNGKEYAYFHQTC